MRTLVCMITILVCLATAVVIQYSEDYMYNRGYWATAGSGFAQRYTPPFNPGVITFAWARVGNPPDEPGGGLAAFQGFNISIWSYSTSTGLPTTKYWPTDASYHYYQNTRRDDWNPYFLHCNWNLSTDFVLVLQQVGNAPNCDAIWRDTGLGVPNRNFSYVSSSWAPLTSTGGGDLVLKVEYENNNPVEAESIGRIKANYR